LIPHKIEPGYKIIVGPYGKDNIGVDQPIGHKAITQRRMTPDLHRIFHV